MPVLTYLGLMPFAACIVADQMFQAPLASRIFQGYGLAIAAFLMGSWWGIALTRTPSGRMPWFEIGLSNALVIVAVMISLMPLMWGLLAQGGLFVVLLTVERWRTGVSDSAKLLSDDASPCDRAGRAITWLNGHASNECAG